MVATAVVCPSEVVRSSVAVVVRLAASVEVPCVVTDDVVISFEVVCSSAEVVV